MRTGLIAVVAAAILAAPVAASPARDALVRPGVSVGKVSLGMTEAQLRRAMGAPHYTIRRRGTFGRLRVQYQYGPRSEWTVDLAGTPSALRVVSVTTFVRTQRLPNGFGPGTREVVIRRAYGRRLVCERWPSTLFQGIPWVTRETRTCTLPGPAGAATIFVSELPPNELKVATIDEFARVFEIGVRTT